MVRGSVGETNRPRTRRRRPREIEDNGEDVLRHRRGPRPSQGPQGGGDRLRQPGPRPRAQSQGQRCRRGGRAPHGQPLAGEGAAGRPRGEDAGGGGGRGRHRHDPDSRHRPGDALPRRHRPGPEAGQDADVRPRLQHPLRDDHRAPGRRRVDDRAQGPRPPGARGLQGGPGDPGPPRRAPGRERARRRPPPSPTRRASAAPAPASSRRLSPRRRRPTSSASRPCSAAAPPPWSRPGSRRW